MLAVHLTLSAVLDVNSISVKVAKTSNDPMSE